MFNPIAELVIPIGIPSKEAKAENKIHPVTAEENVQYNLKLQKPFLLHTHQFILVYFFNE